jgi:hypothetical protein
VRLTAHARTGHLKNFRVERAVGAVAFMALATSLAVAVSTVIGNGNIAAAAAPALFVTGLFVLARAPVKVSLAMLMFLALALDARGNADGLWSSPLAPVGTLLTQNLNKTVPLESLRVNGMALLLGYLLVVHWARRPVGVPTPDWFRSPVAMALLAALAACATLGMYGIARGGDVQMLNLQLQNFLLAAVVAYLIGTRFKALRDLQLLGMALVAAACVKAIVAIWVHNTVIGADGGPPATATTHSDSMLFASSAALLIGMRYYGTRSRIRGLITPALLLILAGVRANSRRLAWMELLAVAVTFYALAPWTRAKRRLTRATLLLSPLLVVYGVVGWTSNARVFAPVQLLRSVQDGQADRSTLDRDVENFNLVSTFASSAMVGIGFAQPYIETVKGDDISKAFSAYRYVPHNSVLWLWAAGGLLGFTLIWSVPVIAIFSAARVYFQSQSPQWRTVSFTVLATMEVYMLQCWGDMGFGDAKAVFIVGSALGIAMTLRAYETVRSGESTPLAA